MLLLKTRLIDYEKTFHVNTGYKLAHKSLATHLSFRLQKFVSVIT